MDLILDRTMLNSTDNSSSSASSSEIIFIETYENKNYSQEGEALGEGSDGKVIKVLNKTDNKTYALKLINLHINENGFREAQIFSGLKHRHIVRYHNAWQETWNPSPVNQGLNVKSVPYICILMELCNRTVRDVMNKYGYSDRKLLMSHVSQIISGLIYLHSQKVMHRDITPTNLLIDSENEIKLGDFGLACRVSDAAAGKVIPFSRSIGTENYRAPEISSQSYDETVDIYSLGIVIFEMLVPMSEGYERPDVLKKLRKSPPQFPENIGEKISCTQRNTIRAMLDHKSERRPLLRDVYRLLFGDDHGDHGGTIGYPFSGKVFVNPNCNEGERFLSFP